MTLGEDMKRKRASISGCNVILFGDLRATTVLFAAAAPGLRQEDHDALLIEADYCLNRLGHDVSESHFHAEGLMDDAIKVNDRHAAYFLRSPPQGSEVYCAAASTAAAIPEMVAALKALANRHVT